MNNYVHLRRLEMYYYTKLAEIDRIIIRIQMSKLCHKKPYDTKVTEINLQHYFFFLIMEILLTEL